MAVSPIPAGYHTVTPYLILKDAAAAIAFYQKAFGATELFRMPTPDGKIGHAEIKIGNSPLMLADECPEMKMSGPEALGGSPISLLLYVEDVDAIYPRAIAAGAVEVKPLKDQFYGDRSGTVRDPFGHVWTLSTHKEDVSPEEMNTRYEAFVKQLASA